MRAVLLSAMAGAFVVGTAFAGKPGGTTTNFRVDDGAFAAQTQAHGGTGAWVHAKCFQNGTLVYEQYVKYDAAKTATLTLGPTPSWSSGAATCTGEDGYWANGTRWRVNGTDAFTVSA